MVTRIRTRCVEVNVTKTRDEALDLIASMGATSAWLNRLDRLFTVVRTAADNVGESQERTDLLAALDAFRLEFYGADDGSDHPDAVAVPSTPIEDDVNVASLPNNAAVLIIGYPADRTTAFEHRVTEMAQGLAATYTPRPIVILNPGYALKIEAMDEDQMREHGWFRG